VADPQATGTVGPVGRPVPIHPGGKGALSGDMPIHKYVANRALTFIQNILFRHTLSEYHTGYRAFTRSVLEALPLEQNSDDFIFNNQMLSQVIYRTFRVGEISCPTS
jgi:hypothetical protein